MSEPIVARYFMYFVGAVGAGYLIGFGWLIRDVPDLLMAERRGRLQNRTPHAPPILREAEPERFERLRRYRKQQLKWPMLMIIGSTLGLAVVLLLGQSALAG